MCGILNAVTGRKEEQFWHTLQNLFVGVPVEGESGYINLMRLKTQYFQHAMRPVLEQFVNEQLREFPDFRKELFDKLYTFLKRYISEETGSIGFFFTPYHQSVYEQVYTDTQDVILFWKTQRLYYVKTDRLFRSMETEVDGFKFCFDASTLEHKKANEKRELVFEFKQIRPTDGAFVFTMQYSERGRQTNLSEVRRALRDSLGLSRFTDAVPSEETLERAFRVFERQSEVDYFLCKDAKSFLREQFDLWLWQYLLGKPGEEPQTEWSETRLRQLQLLKRVAYRVIDYIAAFEDELVRIWNKPKFVLNSNYVITLDRIVEREGGWEVLEAILEHPNLEQQIQEWRELGMVDEDFTPSQIVARENLIDGKQLNPRYQYLPIDTRYFKDLELRILGLFDHLDDALDGWLIKSENYQALNTILPKWQGKVQCIYIDPPFNLSENAEYDYEVKYIDSTWLTLLENRISIAYKLLSQVGSIFVRVGHDGNMLVRELLNLIFGSENYRNEIIVRRAEESKGEFTKQFSSIRSLTVNYDNLYWYSKSPDTRFAHITKKPDEKHTKAQWHSFWKAEDRPNLRYKLLGEMPSRGQWMWDRERAQRAVENYQRYLREYQTTQESLEQFWERTGKSLEFIKKEGTGRSSIKYWIPPRDEVVVDNNWLDIKGYSNKWGFKTENSEPLLRRVISITKNKEVCLDFFAGSGTTAAVVHKMWRRYIAVEQGGHFYSVLLCRMKRVAFGDSSGVSGEVGWTGGGFFKYYELEQFEDALRRTRYAEEPLDFEDAPRYLFLRDLKMTDALQVEDETVRVALERLDPPAHSSLTNGGAGGGIDLAETLSNLLGKPIQRIEPDPADPTRPAKVIFADGSDADLLKPDWKLIKPLIWW